MPSTGAINAIITVGDELLLRIPKDVPEGWRDTFTESVAVPVAVAAGVRTPALVAFDESCDIVEVPFGAYEWWHAPDGEPTTDEGWRDLGRDLALLHGVDPADVDDPLDRLDAPGRATSVDQLLDGGLSVDDERALDELRHLEPAVQDPTVARCFLHDDLKGSNLLVDPEGGYRAVIDWGDAGWGDGAIDFRRLPPDQTPFLLEGYREVRPTDDGFEQRIRWDQLVHHLWWLGNRRG